MALEILRPWGNHRSGLRLADRYKTADFAAILDSPFVKSIGRRPIELAPGSAPAISMGSRGPQLSFNGTTQYLTTPSIEVGTAFTVIVGQTPRATNAGYDRLVETDFASAWFLGGNFSGANYCWIVNNASLEGCIGGTPTVGTRDLVVGTFAGSTRTLYVNGNQVASASATAPTPANMAMAIARQASAAAGYWEGDFDLLVVLPFAITAAEVRAIYEDEIGVLFAPRRIWVPVSAGGGGGTTISVPAGSLALTGFAPTVSATDNQIIAVPAGALTLAGFAPTVNVGANQTISVPAGSLTMTGFAPTVQVGGNQTIAVPAGSLTLTGFAPTVVQTAHQTISVPLGTLVMAGYAPTVSASGSYTISVPLGALVLTGYAPVVNNSGASATVTVKLGSWIRYKILT